MAFGDDRIAGVLAPGSLDVTNLELALDELRHAFQGWQAWVRKLLFVVGLNLVPAEYPCARTRVPGGGGLLVTLRRRPRRLPEDRLC